MTKIDIRNMDPDSITEIVFSDPSRSSRAIFTSLQRQEDGVCLLNEDDVSTFEYIGERDARYLIRALQQALDLGWFED